MTDDYYQNIDFNETQHYDFCSYCDKDLIHVTDRDRMPTRFCCEEHKIDFHNTRRKIERLADRLDKAIKDMGEHLKSQSGSELRALAAHSLMHAQKLIEENRGDVRYVCTECGQTRYFPPKTGEICPFCQHSNTFRLKC